VFASEKVFRGTKSWVRNLNSSIFIRKFERPKAWKSIIKTCRKVLKLTGVDIAGFDVAFNTKENKYYIIEMNTACGMGKHTRKAYTKELNKIALIKQFEL